MARRHPILRGFAILFGVVLSLLVVIVGAAVVMSGGLGDRLSFGPSVAVVDLRGVISDATDTIDALERYRKQDNTVAVVLRIESPGGAVAPSQEIYDEVLRVRDHKPVVASLGNVAASGGYYVASAAKVIVADPGTITGSIGVIMSVPFYAPLADKVGFSEEVVKSGPFKDTGQPLRPMTADERALLQGMVDDVLGQFVDAVARGRNMDAARVRELADGRIYSGSQARAAGLVDQLGGLEDATRLAWTEAGQTGEPRVSRERVRRHPWWLDLLGSTLLDGAALGEPHLPGGGLLFLYRGSGLE